MTPTGDFAYLDASAFVKLVVEEPGSGELAEYLGRWPLRVSSSLLAVEGVRACARVDEQAADRAERMLSDVTLIPAGPELLGQAARLGPAPLRSLDAIHLATALSLGGQVGTFLAYDRRLLDAARARSIPVARPE